MVRMLFEKDKSVLRKFGGITHFNEICLSDSDLDKRTNMVYVKSPVMTPGKFQASHILKT